MKILVYETSTRIKMEYLDYLSNLGHQLIDQENESYDSQTIDALIVYKNSVDKTLLDGFPHLKMVMKVGVGLEKIDCIECEKRKIKVLNTPGSNSDAVADMALRGTLTLQRNSLKGIKGIFEAQNAVSYHQLGTDIKDCTIAFIGFGHIGKKIYNRLLGCGCQQFSVYDPHIQSAPQEYQVKLVNDMVELDHISDIIYLALPLTTETSNMINARFLANCKSTVTIINTSRGGIVNEQDLYDFLLAHPQAKYYADVRSDEPLITSSIQRLMTLDNFLLTPHMAALTTQAMQSMHHFALE